MSSLNLKLTANSTKPIIIPKNTRGQVNLSVFSAHQVILKLNSGAKLDLIQTGGKLNSTRIELDEGSLLNYFVELKYDDETADNFIAIKLKGAKAEVNLNIVVVGTGHGRVNIGVQLEHLASHTTGLVQIRRLQYGSSQSQVYGKLCISPKGMGTNTYLSDKSLLIGKKSQALSKPQLEIKTNNVKASHGAAVGHINPDDLFYLQSHGLTKTRAIEYLCQAFIAPVLRK